jgi:L-rhamnonate dehydratase
MKVTGMRVREVTGMMTTDGPFWEDRLVRPLDIYPEHRNDFPPWGGEQVDERHFKLTQWFLVIETDEGVSGTAGPLWPDAARLCLTQLAPLIVGRDPLAIELLWDQMHRAQVHGRQGDAMIALVRGRLCALGFEGAMAEPARVAAAERADADGGAGLRLDARLCRRGSWPRA